MRQIIGTCIIFSFVYSTTGQQCNIQGLCVGTTLTSTVDGDKAECVDLCKATEGCEYYSFDNVGKFCSAYQSCLYFDTSCNSCVSGEDECPRYQCSMSGGCIGVLEAESPRPDEESCGDSCEADDFCNWFTFFPDSGNCLHYSTCDLSEDQCANCVTSEKACSEYNDHDDGEGNLLLVIKAVIRDEISVIDLSDPDNTCQELNIGPFATIVDSQSLHGTFVGGKFLACGVNIDQCYEYNEVTDNWDYAPRRVEQRFVPYGLDIGNGQNWVSGGSAGRLLDSSEIYNGFEFAEGPTLPRKTHAHCTAMIDENQALIVTGLNMSNSAYIMDLSSGSYVETSPAPINDTVDLKVAMCASATRRDGSRVVVVAGGSDEVTNVAVADTHLYDVDGAVWLPGPDMPQTRNWGRAVQYGSGFVIVGGSDADVEDAALREDILYFDVDGNQWQTLPQRLPNPDFVSVAVLAPPEFAAQCSKSKK